MNRLREFLNSNPLIGWSAAALFAVAVVVLLYIRLGGNSTYSVERMTEMVTIKCTETGEEWIMPRGRMEKELRLRGGAIDASVGLTNPTTGQPTGFPFDAGSWRETVERLNREAEAARAARSGSP
ncbi:MAG: hypothetical protein AAF138_01455 [Planctomycetota bacterium]